MQSTFDEPTRGVDVGTKAEIYMLFRELAMEGLAILLICSDLPEVINVSDRVIVMRHGTLAGELLSDRITEEGIMRLAALGRS
jgi:ABC-type sugar transport system ATPase subunit